MGTPDETMMPIIIAMIVGLIGVFGLVAALRAAYEMRRERDTLRRGGKALDDLALGQETSFDYRPWINERKGLADSHFADHLLAASAAVQSGRTVTLHELHEISARREARRLSARLSGGVTGLLLVCGIAGTLWAIKPVLGDFQIDASAAGVVQGAQNVAKATELIRGLSRAFWPSLVALALTVVVAFVRGFYTHGRGSLASELDHLDLEKLFPRFPPPSVTRELDEIRAQLGDLVAQIVASQHNFDSFVNRLSVAARGFREQSPHLQEASKHFVAAVDTLSPKFDHLDSTLSANLGAASPLCLQLGALGTLAGQVTTIAGGMQESATVLSKHLQISHGLLQKTAADLPAQIASGCQSASTIIAEATAGAIANACTEAVRRLDAAAAPMRDAARDIDTANQQLRSDVKQAIDTVALELLEQQEGIKRDFAATHLALRTDIDATLGTMVQELKTRSDRMEQDFEKALNAAVANITGMHASAADAIASVAVTVARMEQLQQQIAEALAQSARDGKENARIGGDLKSVTSQLGGLSQQLDAATKRLVQSQEAGAGVTDRLAGITAEVGRLTTVSSEIHTSLALMTASQQATTQRVEDLVARATRTAGDWQERLAEAARQGEIGITLTANLDRLLTQGRELASQLEHGAAEAVMAQQRLAVEITALTGELARLEQINRAGLVGRIFGSKQ